MKFKTLILTLIHRPFTSAVIISRIAGIAAATASIVAMITMFVSIVRGQAMMKQGLHIDIIMVASYINIVALPLYLLLSAPLYWFKHTAVPKTFIKEYGVFMTFLDHFHAPFFRQKEALKSLQLPPDEERKKLDALFSKRNTGSVEVAEGMRITKDDQSWKEPGRSRVVMVGFCYPELETRFRIFLDYLVFTLRTKPWGDTYEVMVVSEGDIFWSIET